MEAPIVECSMERSTVTASEAETAYPVLLRDSTSEGSVPLYMAKDAFQDARFSHTEFSHSGPEISFVLYYHEITYYTIRYVCASSPHSLLVFRSLAVMGLDSRHPLTKLFKEFIYFLDFQRASACGPICVVRVGAS